MKRLQSGTLGHLGARHLTCLCLGLIATLGALAAQAGTFGDDELERRLAAVEKVEIEGPEGEKAYQLPAPELLAHFRVGENREVSFYWSPITNDVIYDEVATGSETLLFDQAVPLLERFLALAEDHAPVPFVLLDLEDRMSEEEKARSTAERVLTMESLGTLEVSPEVVADIPQPRAATKAATPSCQAATTFANNHCYYLNTGLIAPNRHDPVWCCDENYPGACGYNPEQGNSMWASLTRSSGSAHRKNSYSAAVACGTNVLVRHWYKFGGNWYTSDSRTQVVIDNQVRGLFVMGGGWYHRKVTYSRLSSSGGLRAYSEFTNP